jgi:hypothetical protein
MHAPLRKTFQRATHVVVACLLALTLVVPAGPTMTEVPTPAVPLQFTSAGHILAFSADGVVAATGGHAYQVHFVDAAATPVTNTSPAQEGSSTPPLSRVTYPDLWPGISLAYDAPEGALLRSTYHLAPLADPTRIRLRYNVPIEVESDGGLAVRYDTGTMRESAPLAWQEIDGQRVPVAVAFRLLEPGAAAESREVGFSLGAYDPAYSLTIDPTLTWNTFLGGSGEDQCSSIAVDASGNVYVAGYSYTTWGEPVRPFSGSSDAFVAQLDSSGALQWNTFLGSSGADLGYGVAVDENGNVYVVGESITTWGAPVRAHTQDSYYDAFIAQLDSSGDLHWHTFLGGGATDSGGGIAVDGSRNVYVAGISEAAWGSPIRPHSGSDYDVFAAQLDNNGILQWNTFLDEEEPDGGFGIAVDGSDNLYVTGGTWRADSGSEDAFAVQLDSNGALQWRTSLGGSGYDFGFGIAADENGNVYIAGISNAAWGTPIRDYSGDADGFVAQLDSSNGAVQWHTFLGGGEYDSGYGIAVTGSGNVYMAGGSHATWGSPIRPHSGGSDDAFAAKLDSNGALQWNAFLGGSGPDWGYGIAVAGSENVYVIGTSAATWGAPVRGYTGDQDTFVAKLSPAPEIDVQGNGQSIPNGSATPSAANHTDFGTSDVYGAAIVHTFTISNSSNLDGLALTGSPPVTLTTGVHFSVSAQPFSLIPADSTTSFDITFAPLAAGGFTDTLSIANTDGDENPYTFVISGTGTANPRWYLPLIFKSFQ